MASCICQSFSKFALYCSFNYFVSYRLRISVSNQRYLKDTELDSIATVQNFSRES
jgi:hypothetical protein